MDIVEAVTAEPTSKAPVETTAAVVESKPERQVRVLHQTVYFNNIDFENEHVVGSSMFVVQLHKDAVSFSLNSSRSKVHLVKVDGIKARFEYYSPFFGMFDDDPNKRRSTKMFNARYERRRKETDAKEFRGELVVVIPEELKEKRHGAGEWFETWVAVTFSVLKPTAGIHFRVSDDALLMYRNPITALARMYGARTIDVQRSVLVGNQEVKPSTV
jgi:hypothetical protein